MSTSEHRVDVKAAQLPEAVYGCASAFCAPEVSYPADMLWFWAGSEGHPAGFYCKESDACLPTIRNDYYEERLEGTWDEDPDGLIGPTLAEEMERRRGLESCENCGTFDDPMDHDIEGVPLCPPCHSELTV